MNRVSVLSIVDWKNPPNTKATGPTKIPVGPYHYLCNGQLTSCFPQPDTERRLDVQGDKIKGQLTLRETVLAEGEASQENTLRWEDYTTTAMDPSDDCTFWYVGDYLKEGDTSYRTRIGSFRLPSCKGGR